MDMLLMLAIIALVGWLAARLAKAFKLSNIFGFITAGIVLGPSCLKLISSQGLTIIAEVAVAILAFKIGSEFVLRDMKKRGTSCMVVTFAEVAGAFLIVFMTAYYLFRQDLIFSLVMASIAAATAPTAAIMVMRQYRADGPVTRMLLPVAALDGVVGVVLFGVIISIARSFGQVADVNSLQMVVRPLVEIFGGLGLGGLLGLALSFFGQKAGDSDELLVITIAMILACTGIAKALAFSPLLSNIMMGAVLVNLTPNSNRVFFSLNNFTPPIYLVFFTLAGASLELSILPSIGLLAVGYLLARAFGKFLGAFLGATGVKAEETVQKYLGIALLPQGGLSIALAILVQQHLPDISSTVIAIIVINVLLYEVIGPMIAKAAIQGAGEIRGLGSTIR